MGRLLKEIIILGLASVAGIYLVFPTFGILEFIPDVIPFVGNLDEAGAVLILLNTLRYYGVDLTKLWGRNNATPETITMDAQPARRAYTPPAENAPGVEDTVAEKRYNRR